MMRKKWFLVLLIIPVLFHLLLACLTKDGYDAKIYHILVIIALTLWWWFFMWLDRNR